MGKNERTRLLRSAVTGDSAQHRSTGGEAKASSWKRDVSLLAIGVLLTLVADGLRQAFLRPALTVTIAQQSEYSTGRISNDSAFGHAIAWDAVLDCPLSETSVSEHVMVDSLSPPLMEFTSLVAIANNSRSTDQAVRLAFAVDSIAPTFSVAVSKTARTSIERFEPETDMARPGELPRAGAGVIVAIEELPRHASVIVSISQSRPALQGERPGHPLRAPRILPVSLMSQAGRNLTAFRSTSVLELLKTAAQDNGTVNVVKGRMPRMWTGRSIDSTASGTIERYPRIDGVRCQPSAEERRFGLRLSVDHITELKSDVR